MQVFDVSEIVAIMIIASYWIVSFLAMTMRATVIARVQRKNAFFKHAEIDEFTKLVIGRNEAIQTILFLYFSILYEAVRRPATKQYVDTLRSSAQTLYEVVRRVATKQRPCWFKVPTLYLLS